MNNNIHLIISGKVQGVGYRVWSQITAQKYNLTGFVQNQKNGDVNIYAEGNQISLQKYITECQNGPEKAHVTHVNVEWSSMPQKYDTFEIILD